MTDFPTGTVTFLFTDLVGSTAMWEAYPIAMQTNLAVHDEILKSAVREYHGSLIKTTGDGIHAAFANAHDAVRAALAAQARLAAGSWGDTGPLLVRMGIHTGEAQFREGDYYGSALNRAARIMGLAHGGQVLLSQLTYLLVSGERDEIHQFRGLGEFHLRGLSGSEQLYQVSAQGMRAEFPPLESGISVPHNLPEQLTSFIGRTAEIAALQRLLEDGSVRLVTLLGPGGTGKSRLSLELARLLLEQFRDGVFFVELAPISDPELVPTTIARAIGLREGGGLPPLENLKAYLRRRNILLVLDNLEQVITAAGLIAGILAEAPGLKVLASSRIPLQISGEYEFFIPPLALPDPDSSFETLRNAEALQLLLARAEAVNAGFKLTKENAPVLAAICRRLDGLPLALEIAAARMRMMPPQAILKRLDDSLNLLIRVSRDLPERQQTMRAAIDWSYNLLEPEVQGVFAALSVFVGGFTLEAASQVCDPGGSGDLYAAAEILVSNSLLQARLDAEPEARFAMLQTIRDYAHEKLSGLEEFEELRGRHGQYYSSLLDQSARGFYSASSNETLATIEIDYDNIRAAMNWAAASPTTFPLAARMVFQNFWFWYRNGHFHEGREWTNRIIERLDLLPNPVLAGLSLVTAGMMAMWEGDLAVAEKHSRRGLEILHRAEEQWTLAVGHMVEGIIQLNRGKDAPAHAHLVEALAIYREAGDAFFIATTMVHLANVAIGLGNLDEARALLHEAQGLAAQVRDPWLIAFAANNLGEVARVERDFEKARPYYEETHRQYALAGAKGDQARLVYTFGCLEMHDGKFAHAEACFRESLSAFLSLGNKRGIAECLAALAGLGAIQGRTAWAAPLLAAAEGILSSSGAAWWPADRVEIEAFKARIEADGVVLAPGPLGNSLQLALEYAAGAGSI